MHKRCKGGAGVMELSAAAMAGSPSVKTTEGSGHLNFKFPLPSVVFTDGVERAAVVLEEAIKCRERL